MCHLVFKGSNKNSNDIYLLRVAFLYIQFIHVHLSIHISGSTSFLEPSLFNDKLFKSVFVYSSRSHLLVILNLEGHDLTSNARTTSTLTLVDLAGSERVAKTEATGQQLVEGAAINRSLSALGQVSSVCTLGFNEVI